MPRKRKRTWGSGSVFEREGRWMIRWHEAGRRRAKSFPTEKLARDVLAKIVADIATGKAGLPTESADPALIEKVIRARGGEEIDRLNLATRIKGSPKALALPVAWTPDVVARFKTEILDASHRRDVLSGVYFLIAAGEIVYVGQSVNVFARLASHQRGKDFDRFGYITCDLADLDTVEARFIKAFRPALNRKIPPVPLACSGVESEVSDAA
jgi:hypothetical protein